MFSTNNDIYDRPFRVKMMTFNQTANTTNSKNTEYGEKPIYFYKNIIFDDETADVIKMITIPVYVLGIIFCMLSLGTFLCRKTLKNPSCIFIATNISGTLFLCVSGLVVTCLCAVDSWSMDLNICSILVTISLLPCSMSVITGAVITYERYILVVVPSARKMTKKCAKNVALLCIFFSCIIGGSFSFNTEQDFMTLSNLNMGTIVCVTKSKYVSLMKNITLFGIICPALFVYQTIANVKILNVLHNQQRFRRRSSLRNLKKIIITCSFVSLLIWLPKAVLEIVWAILPADNTLTIPETICINSILGMLCCIGTIFHVFTNNHYKKFFLRLKKATLKRIHKSLSSCMSTSTQINQI